MKNLFLVLIVIAGSTFFFSCKKDDAIYPNKSKVQLIINSSQTVPVKAPAAYSSMNNAISTLTLESFKVNITEIEFGIDEEAEGVSGDVLDSLVEANEFKGQFLVDLLSQKALDGLSIGSTYIPNAIYEEIEFKMKPSTDNSKPDTYNRTVYITGMLNGKPLKFWTTEEFEYKIEFPDGSNFSLTGDNFKLYLDFSLGLVINSFNQFDFSTVHDGNNNGVYEIGPNDTDGNTELAHYIADAMENSFELDKEND